MASEATKTKALDALEGMRQIVRREMLIRGVYLDEEISNPRLSKTICGGRKHCAIGSLWAGGGIKPLVERWDNDYMHVYLPGVDQDDREEFLHSRHGLRLAYNSLNDAAEAFGEEQGIDLDSGEFSAPIESLFEGHYEQGLTKRDLLKVISAAKRRVKVA